MDNGTPGKVKCASCEQEIGGREQKWKCCPKHVTEQGPDVVCYECIFKINHGFPEDRVISGVS